MIQLTEEQNKIVTCDLQPGESLKVIAFAGTGKTSTLIEYTRARPEMRFLYVAFNKSVQLEAAEKFPPNVTARTSHSLAFRAIGYHHKNRLISGFKANTVMDVLKLDKFEDAKFTIDTLNNYLISSAPKVSKVHIPYPAKIFYEQKKVKIPDFVSLTNRLGRLMCDASDDRIGMLHDGYLKLYQLKAPRLNFDCILLDEAQDINPVTSSMIMSQTRPGKHRQIPSIILVGDSHQQIYSFRGARDTLNTIMTTRTFYLTRSFRFDNKIAALANMVLQSFKGEKRSVVGNPGANGEKPKWNSKRYTVIARTNASIFDKAVKLCGKHKIGFIGGIKGYRLNRIRDIYYLFASSHERISDSYIKRFALYQDLKAYARAVEDIELMSICKVVDIYKYSIPNLVNMISENAADASEAEILLTTVHKSKGLEWQNVHLMSDFPSFVENSAIIKPESLDPDEFNLVYVAITRTISRLRFDKDSTMPEFIKLARKKAAG
jgi:F-box protein 18 (helicase)